jgi:hypothetical protein
MQSWLTSSLIALSAAYSAVVAYAVARGSAVSESTGVLWLLVFSVLITLWAREDRRATATERDYSWLLMFFFWPVVLAYHLVKSRRLEGAVMYVGFVAVYLAPNYVQLVTWACCGRPSS